MTEEKEELYDKQKALEWRVQKMVCAFQNFWTREVEHDGKPSTLAKGVDCNLIAGEYSDDDISLCHPEICPILKTKELLDRILSHHDLYVHIEDGRKP